MSKIGKTVTSGVHDGVNIVVDGVGSIVDRVGEGVEQVAMSINMPLIDDIVKINVHSGFWNAYLTIRKAIHAAVRRYLQAGDRLLITGHSLGGALATFAAIDLTLHTVRPFNMYTERRASRDNRWNSSSSAPSIFSPVLVTMYNYGSPRVGSRKFAEFYNQVVPDSFRVVVDGDVVVTLPFSALAYRHVGCLVIVDAEGLGSIIIDPSDVEKKLRAKSKAYINNHQLIFYKNGLEGVLKRATKVKETVMTEEGASGGVGGHSSDGTVTTLTEQFFYDSD